MKREIKFRIYDIENKEYIEEPDFRWVLSMEGRLYNSENDEWFEIGARYIIEFHVCKLYINGKDIYEGDVVKYIEDCSEHTGRCNMKPDGNFDAEYRNYQRELFGIIYFDNKLLSYMIKPIKEINYVKKHITDYNIKIYDVVGNVFDNPELFN